MNIYLERPDVTVKCHPYRTARVLGPSIDLDRTGEEAQAIEALLAKKANVREDNHVVYTISVENGDPPLHVYCTGDLMRIGTKIDSL